MTTALAAEAALCHNVSLCYGFITVESLYSVVVTGFFDTEDTVNTASLDLCYVSLAFTSDADNVDVFSVNSVLNCELVEGECVAGLKECKYLSLFCALLDEVL